jgi:hypothetical protein
MALAIAKVKRFEGSGTKIYRARKGLLMNNISTASNKLTVASAMLSLAFLVPILFMGNSALQN